MKFGAGAILVVMIGLMALPTASAFDSRATLCPYSSPIPGAPVGGVVGQAYTGAKGAADSGAGAGTGVTCATVGFAAGLVNPTCQFLIGTNCL